MARPPSGLATALAVLGAALVVLGSAAMWIERTIGHTDTFAAMAGELARPTEIRTALAEAAVDPLFEGSPPALALQREIAVGLVAGALANERFLPAFRQVLRAAHTRLVEREHGPVEITLEVVVEVAREELAEISPELAARVDAIETPEIVVVARQEADALRALLDFARAFGLGLVVTGAVMVLIAALRNGGRAFVAAGVAAIVTSAVVFVLLLATRAGVLAGVQGGRAREAVGAGWDVVVSGLLWTLAIAAGAGVVSVALGIAFSRPRRGRRARA